MATGMRPFSIMAQHQQQQQQQQYFTVGNNLAMKNTVNNNFMGGESQEQQDGLLETDEFKMYFYKVIPCSKRCCHDWTTCPYAHPGEKAARRDPRLFNYVAQVCAEVKKAGYCDRGSLCMYAHNVFEYWLHPTKYRTQLCNDGTDCRRKQVCFFAHTLDELRVPAAGPGALSAFDASQGGLPQPATVKLKDALAQEKAKCNNVTGGSASPVSPAYPGYVNHQPPPPPPPLAAQPVFNHLQQPQAGLFQGNNSTEETMAKTQDLLQQLQLIQAFKGASMSGEMVGVQSSAPDTWMPSTDYQNGTLYRKSRSSSSSTSYAPSMSPYPSFLPPSPPPNTTTHFNPQYTAFEQGAIARF
eukprot:TRINITY_DN6406_c0_g1_i10.p1 TRINITY_DN6406_c0_g1~~TRINITY_DN6406_c0_g1_i10.p1  ORF type:complete len:355 (+),score=52.73 TRINITY_DN6406_c0_g1_i10:116-1180(+)